MTPARRMGLPAAALTAVLLLLSVISAASTRSPVARESSAAGHTGSLPVRFEANRGQAPGNVLFLSRARGSTLFLTGDEAVLVRSSGGDLASDSPRPPGRSAATAAGAAAAIRMRAVGGTGKPAVSGRDLLRGPSNYLVGSDPRRWLRDIPAYARVDYAGVYPGIDLVFRGGGGGLEYDLIVSPRADPSAITLQMSGQTSMAIDGRGDLVLATPAGPVVSHRPDVYQELDGARRTVDAGYVVAGRDRIAFRVSAYDRNRPLIIDPVLDYSTFLGGSGQTWAAGIAVDAAGSAYLAGSTMAVDLPASVRLTGGGRLAAGRDHVFVSKLTPNGDDLEYSTYIGGDGDDVAGGIAVDGAGHAFLTGGTNSRNFPVTKGALQTGNPSGSSYAFVVQLDTSGSSLVYATYLGGTDVRSSQLGHAIAVDAAGSAYVAGGTDALDDFPRVHQIPYSCPPPLPPPPGAQPSHGGLAFVAKLRPGGGGLDYASILGCDGAAEANGIAVNPSGEAFVSGYARQFAGFPTTPRAFLGSTAVSGDSGFVARLNAAGSAFIYSTLLRGSNSDDAAAIAIDHDYAYVTGKTLSADFPTTPGAFQQRPRSGGQSVAQPMMAFVTKLQPNGAGLAYSTFLGGAGYPNGDVGNAVAVNRHGEAVVVGDVGSPDFPVQGDPNNIQATQAPGAIRRGSLPQDAFVTKLSADGSALRYSTYLGGDGTSSATAVAVSADRISDDAHVGGWTEAPNFPLKCPLAVGAALSGIADAFVARISPGGDPRLPYVCTMDVHEGPVSGGTRVHITGGKFTGAVAVSFGASRVLTQPCIGAVSGVSPCFTVDSDSQITVYSPAVARAETVDVRVVAPLGESATTAADTFKYLCFANCSSTNPPPALPVVLSIAPGCGPAAGGTLVDVRGAGLGQPLTVNFGRTPSPRVIPMSDAHLQAQSPAQLAGTADIVVTTLGGSSRSSSADVFASPCFVKGGQLPGTPAGPAPGEQHLAESAHTAAQGVAGPQGGGVQGPPSPPTGTSGPGNAVVASALHGQAVTVAAPSEGLAPGGAPLAAEREKERAAEVTEHAMVARTSGPPPACGLATLVATLGSGCLILNRRRTRGAMPAVALAGGRCR